MYMLYTGHAEATSPDLPSHPMNTNGTLVSVCINCYLELFCVMFCAEVIGIALKSQDSL